MALGRQGERQVELMVGWAELPRSPGHAFYDRLQAVLVEAGFDRFAESRCATHYTSKSGRPSLPPGRYFRMHLVGYFEGIDSERGLEWRCADSLSLREFLRLGTTERVPDHSWLSKTRSRLPLEVHEAIFTWVLQRLAERGLIQGDRIGVDASTMEANAALRCIVRRDSGEGYREMLKRLAKESGIETPTAEDLIRLDRQRKGKRLSNEDWSLTERSRGEDRQAQGWPHSAGLQARACGRPGYRGHRRGGDPPRRPGRHHDPAGHAACAEANLAAADAAPTPEDPAELVADKGYHSREGLKDLEDGPWKSRIAEKKVPGVNRWRGDGAARRAVYNNRARLRSGVAREAFRLRGELVERSFALTLDRGGMRRAWLRGRENLHKRYLVHVAGYNLGLIMRLLVGAGTPRELLARVSAHLLVLIDAEGAAIVILAVATDTKVAMLVVSTEPEPPD